MNQTVPKFGEIEHGREYEPRPGAYAVALNQDERVMLVEIEGGLYLPGGGLHDGETVEQALHREVREETGYSLRIIAEIGCARQFVLSAREQRSFDKICSFYLVDAGEGSTEPSEPDHRVLWLAAEEAMRTLRHGSQRWALARALRLVSGRSPTRPS